MTATRDRIIVIENDPMVSDLVARQALQSSGYQVLLVGDAASAIPQILQFSPDILIVDMNLPGLSGKDFMVALSAQGITTPVIALSARHIEGEILQAFRLGATDFLFLPVREAEVVSAVERVLRQVRERREREQLAYKLQQTNQELQQRVRELTTMFSVGKAVISITDQRSLFDKLVEGAVKVTQADMGWFLLRDEGQKSFVLAAQRSLPNSLVARTNQPWDDGVSSLVAMSGEALSIYGEPFKRFKISSMGQSALIVPVKVQKQVIGLLATMRKAPKPFTTSDQTLLEAVSDYASISLVNSRLFRALEERARSLQGSVETAAMRERINADLLRSAGHALRAPLEVISGSTAAMLEGKYGRVTSDQRQLLTGIRDQAAEMQVMAGAIGSPASAAASKISGGVNLCELARQAVACMAPHAQRCKLTLSSELSAEPVLARGDAYPLLQVLIGLLSNAIKFTPAGGSVTLVVDRLQDDGGAMVAHAVVRDSGVGIEPRHLPNLFERGYHVNSGALNPTFGGLGICLNLIKEVLAAAGGRVWVDSRPGSGSAFHISLPLFS